MSVTAELTLLLCQLYSCCVGACITARNILAEQKLGLTLPLKHTPVCLKHHLSCPDALNHNAFVTVAADGM